MDQTLPERGWMTASEHASAIDAELAVGNHDFALRLLRQALEDLDYLARREDRPGVAEFLAEPPSIEDRRWQSLFVLTIAVSCDRNGIDRPRWTRVDRLEEPFFPARPGQRFLTRTVERTAPEFADANIWIDERDLAYALW